MIRLSLPTPDTCDEEPLPNSVALAGWGLLLVRQMMDAVSYARVAGRNQLRMTKHLTG